jgi:putative GTP pyrophosphokinase
VASVTPLDGTPPTRQPDPPPLLTAQRDIRVLKVKDYIKEPKANGYQSLHVIVEVPVFLSTGAHPVAVEVQIRTIAMDFWASLEHKIYYKYDRQVPQELLEGLTDAAHTASELDVRMERLHREVHGPPRIRHTRRDIAI